MNRLSGFAIVEKISTTTAKIIHAKLKKVEKFLNNRSRKRLNYCTPKEVFNGKDFKKFDYLLN